MPPGPPSLLHHSCRGSYCCPSQPAHSGTALRCSHSTPPLDTYPVMNATQKADESAVTTVTLRKHEGSCGLLPAPVRVGWAAHGCDVPGSPVGCRRGILSSHSDWSFHCSSLSYKKLHVNQSKQNSHDNISNNNTFLLHVFGTLFLQFRGQVCNGRK